MVKFDIYGNIGVILLNRPEKRNALVPEMIAQLSEKLNLAEADNNLKVLILSGEGSSFCSGADLDYLHKIKDYSIIENTNDSQNLASLYLKIYNFPKPTIAAVNGAAIAGGCGLATVCDFIIADKTKSKFGYPEVKIGFIPAIVSTFLIRKIGEGKTRRLLISGEIINAEEAVEIGLVNYLADDALGEAKAFAQKLLNNSSDSMNETKKLINKIADLSIFDAVKYSINMNTITRTTKDFEEGINNFINKK